jgi:hypothetical protein
MTSTSLTLALEGDVTLAQYAEALRHFNELIRNLSDELAAEAKIEWELYDLEYGSAILTIDTPNPEQERVFRVVEAFEQVAESLQKHEPIPFSPHIARPAQNLSQLIRGGLTSLRFETARRDVIIYGSFDSTTPALPQSSVAFGSLKGRVQAISSRNSKQLVFTLYDHLFDRPVRCYLEKDQKERLKNIWDQWVMVTGWITRQPNTGYPSSIRHIRSIDLFEPVEPGSYRQAAGILAGLLEDEPAAVSIRRIRDA